MASSTRIFKPHPYQARAIDWILERQSSALFLDMGLGKTIITLTAISRLIDIGAIRRALVVAPKKVAESTWSDEAAKWADTSWLRVVPVLGTPRQRIEALARPADINVITRDSLEWLVRNAGLKDWPFDMIVLDELSSFKNPRSKRWRALRDVTGCTPRIVGLTGTPAPNGLEDLWAQIWPLDYGARLGKNITTYRARYFNAYTLGHICTKYKPKPGADKAIQEALSDLCLSMQAADYLTLPEMIEIDVNVHMATAERKAYTDFEREQVLSLPSGEEVVASTAAALMNKLSQYTSGALYSDPPQNTAWTETSIAKIEALTEIVEAANSPVLVFYQYRHEVPRITEALKARYHVRVYSGAADLEAWNAGKIDVLLAHPASTAFGLNMQAGGHTIVWTSVGWNLELYLQANARLHRQGQTQPVRVYRLLCPGTVDHRAADALKHKDTQQTSLLRALRDLRKAHTLKP